MPTHRLWRSFAQQLATLHSQPSALLPPRLCTTPTSPACAQTLRLTLGGSGISGLRAAGADVLRAGRMWSAGGACLASALREPSLLMGTPVALLRGPAGLWVDRSTTGLAVAHSACSAHSACPATRLAPRADPVNTACLGHAPLVRRRLQRPSPP
jgi:hypothetical protein